MKKENKVANIQFICSNEDGSIIIYFKHILKNVKNDYPKHNKVTNLTEIDTENIQ